MAINKVWVLAEAFEGKPLSITQELLTKARELASEVSAWAWGDDVASYAGELGSYGATKVYSLGDLGGALPGVPLAAALRLALWEAMAASTASPSSGLSRPENTKEPSPSVEEKNSRLAATSWAFGRITSASRGSRPRPATRSFR